MQVYKEDPETREFAGSVQLPQSPLWPGRRLPLAFTHTETPPEVPEGSVARWDRERSAWTVVPDHRGVWYRADQQEVRIEQIDADISGLTRIPPPSRFHDLQNGSWVLNSARAREQLKLEVNQLIDSESLVHIAEYPTTETLGFARKAAEATAGAGTMLEAELASYYAGKEQTPPRNALQQLSHAVRQKDVRFSRISGYAAGVRRVLHEKIDALSDQKLSNFDAETEFRALWNPRIEDGEQA